MSRLIPITLPMSTPFPVIISSIKCNQGEKISKHQTICNYKYWDYQDDPNSKEENAQKIRVEMVGSYESPIEGIIKSMSIKPSQEIAHSDVELCFIEEPCSHTVQYGGLCALCGKAVEDEKDYSGYTYDDRATISMSHDNSGLKISLEEAAKIEENTTTRLNEERRLILVVDLDQTVIHATVDPTVGEWQSDPSNSNYNAVKDVKSFCLKEEPIIPPDWKGPRPPPSTCWYYVKLRPNLQEFLKVLSQKYEMHIYTMATRSYALAVAKLIDPTGEYFGDRILSRDESGSLTHKDLKRLFPVDQSMVVIIDDRGDVWQWDKNLIKVVPYDFFVGIGDINSNFLPKKSLQLTGPSKKRKSIAKLEDSENILMSEENEDDKSRLEEKASIIPTSQYIESDQLDMSELEKDTNGSNVTPEDIEKEQLAKQSINRTLSIEQQRLQRPLARLQSDLERLQHDTERSSPSSSDESENEVAEDDNLLEDEDDNELNLLKDALEKIHKTYYTMFDERKNDHSFIKPNLSIIIPEMKSKCLEGVTILFSGILPLAINIYSVDIVIWCSQFGANVVTEVYPEVTHVICKDPALANSSGPTFKVRAARKLLPDVKIVNSDWLFSSLSQWKKADEQSYLVSYADKDWFVSDADIEKYQNDIIKKRNETPKEEAHTTAYSVQGLYDSALNEADQEIDEFLAGISDDEEEDEDDDKEDEDDDKDDDDKEEKTIRSNINKETTEKNSSSDVYGVSQPTNYQNGPDALMNHSGPSKENVISSESKKRRPEDLGSHVKRHRNDASHVISSSHNSSHRESSPSEENSESLNAEQKKQEEREKQENDLDIDELEQELLNEFDSLEE